MSKLSKLLFALFMGMPVWVAAAQVVEVESAWVRPTAPGALVGGAYMTLLGAPLADRLLSASSPAAAAVELHTHVLADGIARMRPVAAIEVPAGGRVELKPGGLHLMLINLKAPLTTGSRVQIQLHFETSGLRTIDVPVSAQAPVGAAASGRHSH